MRWVKITYYDGVMVKMTKEELLTRIREADNLVRKLGRFPRKPERFGLKLIKEINVRSLEVKFVDKRKYERIESQVKRELRKRGITSANGHDISPYLVEDVGDYWSVVLDETIKVKKKV